MGRPPNTDPEETRQRLLLSARGMFARYGVAGASVREIARRAGVTVATLSHHFGSKDGLHQACISAFDQELAELGGKLVARIGSSAGDPRALFEVAVREGWRFARRHRDAIRMLQQSIAEAGEVDAATRARRIVPFLETVSAYLAGVTGRSAESFRLSLQSGTFLVVRYAMSSDAELAELAYGSAAPGGGVSPRSRRKRDPMQAIEDHLVDAVLTLLALKTP